MYLDIASLFSILSESTVYKEISTFPYKGQI